MTGAKHRFSGGNFLPGVFVVMGVLLSISLSMNAVFYVLLTWDLVPN
jgi:hypothetical protein